MPDYSTVFAPSQFCIDVFEDVGLVSVLIPFPPEEVDEVTDLLYFSDLINSAGE